MPHYSIQGHCLYNDPSVKNIAILYYCTMSPPQDGVTALFMASQKNHVEVVRLLLQSGTKDIPDKVSIYCFIPVLVISNIYKLIILLKIAVCLNTCSNNVILPSVQVNCVYSFNKYRSHSNVECCQVM